jgi:hypothetical protein
MIHGGRICLPRFPSLRAIGTDPSRERRQSAEHPYVAREMSGSSSSGNAVVMAGTTATATTPATTTTTTTTTTTREEKDSPRAAEGGARGGELQDESAPPSERERERQHVDDGTNPTNPNNSSDDDDDGDDDDSAAADPEPEPDPPQRPSDGRRARLVRDLMTTTSSVGELDDADRSSSVPIQHLYDEATKAYERFLHAHQCPRLDDAFSHGVQYCWHALHVIPTHASYESLESASRKNESVGRVEFITDALDDVRDRMDEEERQRGHLRALLRRLEEPPQAEQGGECGSDGAAGSGGKDDADGGGGHRRRTSGGRRAAHIRARLNVDDFYVSPYVPIEQHFERAHELHASFVKARRDNNDESLDDAYAFGIRYWLCATKAIPMHPDYESIEHAGLKRESLERADAVFVAVGEIEDKMMMTMMMDRDEDEELEELENEGLRLEIGEEAEATAVVPLGSDGPDEFEEEEERYPEGRTLRMALEKERAERDEAARKYQQLQHAYDALKASIRAPAIQEDRENVGNNRSSSSSSSNESNNPLVTDPSAHRGPTADFSTRVSRRRGVLAEMGTAPNEPRANDNDDDGTRKEPRTPRLHIGIGSAEENHRNRADIDIRGRDRWDRLKSPITVDWRDASAHRQRLHLAHGSAATRGRQSAPNERDADGKEPSGDGSAGTGPSKRARPSSQPRGPRGKRSRRSLRSEHGAVGSAIADGSGTVATRRGRSATGTSAGREREADAGDDRGVVQVAPAGTIDCHPTAKCDALMRAVDANEADGLDVFQMATSHFGNVPGGKGSHGRTWVLCHCCAACRATPRGAFVTSYKGTRTESTFFDFRAQEIPKEARDQLLRHLLDQHFREIDVAFPPYCPPPPPPPKRGGRRPPDSLP